MHVNTVTVRSVRSGSGVKNALCVHKEWRLINPEVDFGLDFSGEADVLIAHE